MCVCVCSDSLECLTQVFAPCWCHFVSEKDCTARIATRTLCTSLALERVVHCVCVRVYVAQNWPGVSSPRYYKRYTLAYPRHMVGAFGPASGVHVGEFCYRAVWMWRTNNAWIYDTVLMSFDMDVCVSSGWFCFRTTLLYWEAESIQEHESLISEQFHSYLCI